MSWEWNQLFVVQVRKSKDGNKKSTVMRPKQSYEMNPYLFPMSPKTKRLQLNEEVSGSFNGCFCHESESTRKECLGAFTRVINIVGQQYTTRRTEISINGCSNISWWKCMSRRGLLESMSKWNGRYFIQWNWCPWLHSWKSFKWLTKLMPYLKGPPCDISMSSWSGQLHWHYVFLYSWLLRAGDKRMKKEVWHLIVNLEAILLGS